MAFQRFFDASRWKYVIFAGPESKRPRDIRGLVKDEFTRVDSRSLTTDIFRKHGQHLICFSKTRTGGFLVEHFGNSVSEGIAVSLMDRRRWLNMLDVSRLTDGGVPVFIPDDNLSYPNWLDNYISPIGPTINVLYMDVINAAATITGTVQATDTQALLTGASSFLAIKFVPATGGNASLEMISGTEVRIFEADGTPGVITLHP